MHDYAEAKAMAVIERLRADGWRFQKRRMILCEPGYWIEIPAGELCLVMIGPHRRSACPLTKDGPYLTVSLQ